MVRIYQRDGQQLVVELRAGERDAEYCLRIVSPDGGERVETFSTEQMMRRRLETLDSELLVLDWDRGTGTEATIAGDTETCAEEGSERRAGLSDRRRVTRRDRRTRAS